MGLDEDIDFLAHVKPKPIKALEFNSRFLKAIIKVKAYPIRY